MIARPSPDRPARAGSRPALPRELVPGRLTGLRVPEGGSLLVVHGDAAWVGDLFVGAALDVLEFRQALWVWARAAGFDQVLFSEQGRAAFSLDGEWERRLRPAQARSQPARAPRFAGPLGLRWLAAPATPAPPAPPRGPAFQLTDVGAIQLLDAEIRDDTTRTAVVFLNAEHWLRYTDAPRTFAEIVNRWVGSPPRSGSLCVLVFHYENLSDVLSFASLDRYPALHAALTSAYRRHEGGTAARSAFRLGPPGRAELEGLLHVHRLTGDLRLEDWSELPALIRAMVPARATIRVWDHRFRSLAGPGRPRLEEGLLSLRQMRSHNWIPSHAADGSSATDRLNALAGLASVKASVAMVAATVRQFQRQDMPSARPAASRLNFVFTGNPGTGKTTVARLMGELLRDLGVLPEGHLHELSLRALGALSPGQARQAMHDAVLRARGGVLFIDEAYQLTDGEAGFGRDAITALNQLMEDERGQTSVIIAGYHEPMQKFLRANPGLPDRFPAQYRIEFPDLSLAELVDVLLRQLAERGLSWTPELREDLTEVVQALKAMQGDDFGNARAMENLADAMLGRYSVREPPPGSPLIAADIPADLRPPDLRTSRELAAQALSRLDALVGLAPVKQVLHDLVDRLNAERLRRQLGLPTSRTIPPHMVFAGPPGTGKSTVAAFLGEILHAMGLLRTGHVVKASRSDLVAGYVGQTGPRTKDVVLSARGGVLFVDEAHTLARTDRTGNDFGREAIEELALLMERHRGDLVVVAAGYAEQMEEFLSSDPGLRGRFGPTVRFTPYSDDELVEILRRVLAVDFDPLSEPVTARAKRWLRAERALLGVQFGNARAVGTLAENMRTQQASRLARLAEPTAHDVRTLMPEDVPDD
jgi:SpoVK/Ycf46/Vps4 family AAA+-type ATPase